MKTLPFLLLIPLLTNAANYSAKRVTIDGFEVIRLADAARRTEVSVVPSIGNIAFEMKVNGKNAFWFPFQSLAEFREKPALCGNPFLAPWANRIDQDAFYANGKKYVFNDTLGNLRRDPNGRPIHGLLLFSPAWQVVSVRADKRGAEYTARLEFWKHPDLMAQFPFAHTVQMIHRLRDGVLEVETVLENHSAGPMPVAIGYHPYFRLHDTPRDNWKVHLAARRQPVLSEQLVPTGESTPISFPDPVLLGKTPVDDVFTDLVRDGSGRAEFYVQGNEQRLSVIYGPKYTVAIVYSPAGKDFVCFEPMAAITNAFNLAQAGKYRDLQHVPSGGAWRESFWVKAEGF